jgi:hypothetical protein
MSQINCLAQLSYNKSLQVTFAPPRTFASAKAHVAAHAAELRCWATKATA